MKLNDLLVKYGNIEITEDQEQEIKNKLGIKTKKAWKPKLDERYWYVTDGGRAEYEIWEDDGYDEYRYAIGNCFRAEEEVEVALGKLEVTAELKRFAEEHNEEEIDWKNYVKKNYLYYDYELRRINITYCYYYRENNIYFTSEEIALKAIDEIGKDRLKKYYFEVE